MEVTTARILDKRRMLKKSKKYPLAIRVTFNRKSVLFPINLALSEDDFKKLPSPRLGIELSEIRDKVQSEEERARKIIKSLGTFTFQAFQKEFYKNSTFRKRKKALNVVQMDDPHERGNTSPLSTPAEGKNKKYGKRKYDRIRSNVDYEKWGPLAVAFGDYIKLLEMQERIGTSESYFCSLMNLMRFRKNLRLEDITVLFLYEYERWLRAEDIADATIGIYIRNLRAIINLPRNKKLFPDESYPFGRGKYQIPTGVNIKKALDLLDIKRIYDYQPQTDHPNEIYARDIWLFGYFSNGINPKDIAHLKYKNIDEDGFIIIQREKTKFAIRSKPRKIVIPVNEDMHRIIAKWGNADKAPDNYIFPVLTPGLSAHRRRELVQNFTLMINDRMKRIAASVGIKKKVRTMEYRHTMATVLKRSGASTEFIQEALGHEDKSTTENYLGSFDFSIKKHFAVNLLAFKEITVDEQMPVESINMTHSSGR